MHFFALFVLLQLLDLTEFSSIIYFADELRVLLSVLRHIKESLGVAEWPIHVVVDINLVITFIQQLQSNI